MDTNIIYVILIVFFLILLGLGLPIAFALGSLSVLGILWQLDPKVLYQIGEQALNYGSNWLLVTIPLFVFMAEIISTGGLGTRIFTSFQTWLIRLPGGLAVSSIGACAGFGAVCGSSPVTAATIGLVAVPQMMNRGYNRKLALGSVAAGGTLGIMIPPSLSMIIYGSMTGTSIGKLFIAGIIPGIVLASILSLYVVIRVKLNPSLAPTLGETSWKNKFESLEGVWPVLVIAIFVSGSIYTGIATPTECAAVGAAATLLFALISRKMDWSSFRKALVRTSTTTCMIIFLAIGGTSIAFLLGSMGLPSQMSNFLQSLHVPPWIIIVFINIIYFILGCLLDPMSVLVITLPFVFPVVSAIGFDPVWFGVIVTLNIELGMITPPVGMNLFVLKAVIPDVTMEEIVVGSLPFIILLCMGLAILMIFPELALWLPSTMK